MKRESLIKLPFKWDQISKYRSRWSMRREKTLFSYYNPAYSWSKTLTHTLTCFHIEESSIHSDLTFWWPHLTSFGMTTYRLFNCGSNSIITSSIITRFKNRKRLIGSRNCVGVSINIILFFKPRVMNRPISDEYFRFDFDWPRGNFCNFIFINPILTTTENGAKELKLVQIL